MAFIPRGYSPTRARMYSYPLRMADGIYQYPANHTLGYYELKEIRYKFMPNDMEVAQIFPPREEFINLHENCFHLYELTPAE